MVTRLFVGADFRPTSQGHEECPPECRRYKVPDSTYEARCAPYFFSEEWLSFRTQKDSRSSRPGLAFRIRGAAVQGFSYAFGSSNIKVICNVSASTRLKRSTTCRASECGWPTLSSQVFSLKPIVSTIN